MASPSAQKVPWHLWPVGVAATLWNAIGCYDYFMTETKGADYMRAAGMTDGQIAYVQHLPVWYIALWAIGVWGGLLGGVLLLLRKRLAVGVFLASCVAFVLTVVYSLGLGHPPELGPSAYIFDGVIFFGCLFFIWYSRQSAKNGVLH